MLSSSQTIMALDVGARRVGIATAHGVARLASPLKTLERTEDFIEQLKRLVKDNDTAVLVIGWPRGLEGQHTGQTQAIEAFVTIIKQHLNLPLYLQDEAVTSRKAEAELKARGKPYAKGDIDALAATYILEDFLQDHPEVRA